MIKTKTPEGTLFILICFIMTGTSFAFHAKSNFLNLTADVTYPPKDFANTNLDEETTTSSKKHSPELANCNEKTASENGKLCTPAQGLDLPSLKPDSLDEFQQLGKSNNPAPKVEVLPEVIPDTTPAQPKSNNEQPPKTIIPPTIQPAPIVPKIVKTKPIVRVDNRPTCRKKNDHPQRSKTKGTHMDEDCCIDPDEYPDPKCRYTPAQLAIGKSPKK